MLTGRYVIATSAGQRNGKRFAVLDRQDMQGGKGMRRVSFHATHAGARRAIQKLEAPRVTRCRNCGGVDGCFPGCRDFD